MATKCVHKGCGKVFTSLQEPCHHHPGPPEFHEGQKGWKCCKPRVLTFDEFLAIPPCTTGTHSAVDDTPAPLPPDAAQVEAAIRAETQRAALPPPVARTALPAATPSPPPPTDAADDDDDPATPVPAGATCKRKACGATHPAGSPDRQHERCAHHPGQPLFHEGSKGWTCCKRRVLEFDDFLQLPGCTTKPRHLFVGRAAAADAPAPAPVPHVRHDFYQTATTVHASLYLKAIDAARSHVRFPDPLTIDLDLRTADNRTRHAARWTLYAPTAAPRNAFRITPSKLELTLAKADPAAAGWPVLRRDDPPSGAIIQAGRAGSA